MKKTKPNKRTRARTERRRQARKAAKQARREGWASSPVRSSSGHDEGGGHYEGYDDCPMCQALSDIGAPAAQDGVVVLTDAQQQAYQRRLDEIVAEKGWPDEMRWISGEEAKREYEYVNRVLEEGGHATDIDAMNDQELGAHFERVREILAARDDSMLPRALA